MSAANPAQSTAGSSQRTGTPATRSLANAAIIGRSSSVRSGWRSYVIRPTRRIGGETNRIHVHFGRGGRSGIIGATELWPLELLESRFRHRDHRLKSGVRAPPVRQEFAVVH